ncbi:Protein MEI2-like 6 [Platanthera guangdongensis]|uniref:Protein MEI2-like 6 n=1 Tax=Platanthera guangdongensis TaxID=2320717 RepID=A0ABR2N0V2_9ASPA
MPAPDDELNSGSWKTTVMLKNIPNKFSKLQLLDLLDEHCRKENTKAADDSSTPSEFDFFYLPMDFQSGSNLGYAFVNFTSVAAARKLHGELHHKPWNAYGSRKVCEVTQAKIQGSDGLLKHFKASIFTCSSESYLPVFFNPSRDGFRHTQERLVGKLVYLKNAT